MHAIHAHRTRSSLAAVSLLLLWMTSGCDGLVDPVGDSIFLTSPAQEFCFRFTGVTAGGSKSILSANSIDLGAYLQQQGFTRSDVISATVQSAEISLLFPIDETLSMLDRASVSLRAGGEAAVASAEAFSDARRADLTVSGADVAGIVQAATFQAVLQLAGARTVAEDIEISVSLRFRIEVEGV